MTCGRHADPESTLGTDPRSDPRMVKAFAEFGLDGPQPEIPLSVDAPMEERLAFAAMSEEAGAALFDVFAQHKAKREGWLSEIAGFYAQCPFISNRWLEVCEDLPSLSENDGYFVSCLHLALMGSLYDPDSSHANDATCWAAVATDEELADMPPHVISVNELDPMRDEGLQYYRRLVHAGVPAVGRMVAGTCHGGDLLMAHVMPEVFDASIRDVSSFAKSLG